MKNIVIIGGGLGGLTAGALLAKEGHKVTLLEQHNIVGGSATTFKRGKFTCEVGLHEMDGVYGNSSIVNIFNKLDVYDNVEFINPDEFFSIRSNNEEFIMPDGIEKAIEALVSKFPEEREAIEKYFENITKISTAFLQLSNMPWYKIPLNIKAISVVLKYQGKTLAEMLDSLFRNEHLKLILSTNTLYYNDSSETFSFLMHSLGQHSYYSGSGWYIKGGSGRLSDHLAKVIIDNNSKVITKANVLKCGSNFVEYIHKKERIKIDCDIVISNLSPEDTYKLYNKKYQEEKIVGDSLLTLYLGFSKNLKTVYGKQSYSNFLYENIESVEELNALNRSELKSRGLVFVDYSQIDSGLTEANCSFGAVCMIDDFKYWNSLSKDEYKKEKAKLTEDILNRLEKFYPDISTLVEYSEIGTSKTVKRYIKTPQGTAYGFKPTPKQFFKKPKSKSKDIDNLFFVGQWIIAGGFSPSIMSGGICYQEICKV